VEDEPLRIAVVAPPYYDLPPLAYGGIERVCWSLAEGLVERGHDVTLVGAGASATRARFVATFPEAQQEGTPSEATIEVLHAARAAAALDELALDVVHDHTRTGPLLAPSRIVPTLVTVHSPLAGPELQLELYTALARWAKLAALTEAQRRAAPQLPWVGVVPNGIEVDAYPYRAEKDDFVLFLGRMSRHKGVHLAVRAAREAGRRLVIAGTWTIPEEQEYFEMEVRPQLGRDVEWVGSAAGETRTELLASAVCLLFPVVYEEPFGLVMIEAMACGTPVVALPAGSVPEVVVHGETGIICAETGELAAAIDAATRLDPARCRAHVRDRFSALRMVERYEALYRRLLTAQPVAAPAGAASRRVGEC
jgi:glycosyltransferase involved in cell wall biosynthesis